MSDEEILCLKSDYAALEEQLAQARATNENNMANYQVQIEELKAERGRLQELAELGWELSTYAACSKPENQPEFLEGLFERVQKYQDAHKALADPPEGQGKAGQEGEVDDGKDHVRISSR